MKHTRNRYDGTGWDFFGAGFSGAHVDHRAAVELQRTRITELRDEGWTIRPGWDTRSPFGDVTSRGRLDGLLDHLYRLHTPSGDVVYVSEPYWLHNFDPLAELDGWDVVVSSTEALWFPGHTVAVHFTPEDR